MWPGVQEDTTDGELYVAALYFAVSTVATVGFGDIVAVTLRYVLRAA